MFRKNLHESCTIVYHAAPKLNKQMFLEIGYEYGHISSTSIQKLCPYTNWFYLHRKLARNYLDKTLGKEGRGTMLCVIATSHLANMEFLVPYLSSTKFMLQVSEHFV